MTIIQLLLTHRGQIGSLRSAALLAAWLGLLQPSPAEGRVLHVSDTGDGTTGHSWATAYQTIGDGLAAASTGDEIWVKSATYTEAVNLKSGVSVYGGFAGTERTDEFDLRDWIANETIVDATGLEVSTVTADGIVGATVDGFTTTGGEAHDGEGIAIRDSVLLLRNCELIQNQGEQGSGAYILDSTVSLMRCEVYRNIGFRFDGGCDGGVTCTNSILQMKDSTVSDHIGGWSGGGLSIIDSTATIVDSTI